MSDLLENPGQDPAESAPSTDPNEPSQQPTQDPLDPPHADPQDPPANHSDRPSREERRAQRLSQKLRESSNQNAQYRRELESRRPQPQGPNYDDPNLTIDTLQRDREQYGQSQYQRGRQETMQDVELRFFQENLDRDTEVLESKYEELNPGSDLYDQNLVDDINAAYKDAIGYNERTGTIINTGVRYKDYADRFMRIATRYADGRSADAARNVASQAARTGVRPNSPSRQSNIGELQPGDISKMSDKDYEKNKSAIDAQIKKQLGI